MSVSRVKGEPTLFKQKYKSGEKIHTIRMNEAGYFRDGDTVSIRQWSGKPYSSKQVEIGQNKIGVQAIRLNTDGTCMIAGRCHLADGVALNDGLTFDEFRYWFWKGGVMAKPIIADIIHFGDFRYS